MSKTAPGSRGVHELAAKRREGAITLRIEGATYAEIARRLNVSPKQAWKLVEQVLDDLADRTAESAERVRAIEVQRLDRLLLSLWPHVRQIAGESDEDRADRLREKAIAAAPAILKIMERRARLLGLDAPVRVDLSAGKSLEQMIRESYDEAASPRPLLEAAVVEEDGDGSGATH